MGLAMTETTVFEGLDVRFVQLDPEQTLLLMAGLACVIGALDDADATAPARELRAQLGSTRVVVLVQDR